MQIKLAWIWNGKVQPIRQVWASTLEMENQDDVTASSSVRSLLHASGAELFVNRILEYQLSIYRTLQFQPNFLTCPQDWFLSLLSRVNFITIHFNTFICLIGIEFPYFRCQSFVTLAHSVISILQGPLFGSLDGGLLISLPGICNQLIQRIVQVW